MRYPAGPRRRTYPGLLALSVLVLVVAQWPGPACAQDVVRRALILYPENNVYRQGLIVGEAFRKRLVEQSPADVETFSDFLDLSRFPDESHRQRIVGYLAEKYAQTLPDVVFAVGPEVLQLLSSKRGRLMPNVPIVVCCMLQESVAAMAPLGDVAGVASEVDLAMTLALAERLQPRARRLVVIAGASPYEQRWTAIVRAQLAPHEGRLPATYLVGLTREALLKEVAHMPGDTIVIVLSFIRDGAGRNLAIEFIEELARTSSAPIYSPNPLHLGRGVVGGHMESFELVGATVADMALEILKGAKPAAIGVQKSAGMAYRVDARQLERWRLAEKNLPPGAVVVFKESTLWQRHRGVVIATAAVFLLQTGVLAALLMQTQRRRRAERALKRSEERALTLQEEERQRIAQDLHDSTSQHLAAIGLNLMALKADKISDADKTRALADMKGSLQEATRELRTFTYLLHPPGLERDGLSATLARYVEEFGRRTGLETSLRLDYGIDGLPLPLQRSILRIVQEALANVHRHAAASSVSVGIERKAGELHLVISDDGRGIADAPADGEAFRLGVGIQGMTARVQKFGGSVEIKSGSGGTTVHAIVPIA
jgi:signal transduction histidine kinase